MLRAASRTWLAGCVALIWVAHAHAEDARRPGLNWVRLEGAESCLSAARLAAHVEARIGRVWAASDTGLCDVPGALRFTERAIIPEGVTALYRCRSALGLSATGDLEPIDADECKLPGDSARHANTVGDPCDPPVPDGGFLESLAYVETGASECGTGACLVFHLRGDPSPSCDAGAMACAAPRAFAERVYCSCRCDAAPGEPDACDCPDHFICVPTVFSGNAGVTGSYCVYADTRNGR